MCEFKKKKKHSVIDGSIGSACANTFCDFSDCSRHSSSSPGSNQSQPKSQRWDERAALRWNHFFFLFLVWYCFLFLANQPLAISCLQGQWEFELLSEERASSLPSMCNTHCNLNRRPVVLWLQLLFAQVLRWLKQTPLTAHGLEVFCESKTERIRSELLSSC